MDVVSFLSIHSFILSPSMTLYSYIFFIYILELSSRQAGMI